MAFRAFDLYGVPAALRLSGQTDAVKTEVAGLNAARLRGLGPRSTCRASRPYRAWSAAVPCRVTWPTPVSAGARGAPRPGPKVAVRGR